MSEDEMPEKFRDGPLVSFGLDIVLKRPELAAQAMNCCANWAMIEVQLMTIYGFLMGTYLDVPKGFAPEIAPPTHPVAFQVFDTLNNLRSRVDLLTKLCKWRSTPEIYEKLQQLIPDVYGRFRERSVIAHGVWGICEKYPDALILERRMEGSLIYREHDFKQTSQRIRELHLSMGQEVLMPIYESLRQ